MKDVPVLSFELLPSARSRRTWLMERFVDELAAKRGWFHDYIQSRACCRIISPNVEFYEGDGYTEVVVRARQ
jgi:hypothetical protein